MTTALSRRRLLCAACALPLASLVACSREENAGPPVPVDIEASTTCELDGMMLAEYGGMDGFFVARFVTIRENNWLRTSYLKLT